MGCLIFFLCFLLLLFCKSIEAEQLDFYSIQQDIANFNKTCSEENCNLCRLDSLSYRACHCGMQCAQLRTCCIDSYYVYIPQPEMRSACRSVYNGGNYFVVDVCPPDNAWSSLCNAEWNGEDDVQKLVPVTTLLTYITYKNYYCLRCHEATEEFLYWDFEVKSEYQLSADESRKLDRRTSITYFQDTETWMIIYDEDIGYIPVNVSIKVPPKIQILTHDCEPNVISDCSEKWSDEEVRSKCHSYMAIKEVQKDDSSILKYKNIHCALCNFENLNDIQCRNLTVGFTGYGASKVGFSFTYLLDINRSDGELVGKIQKCSDDHIWDPYTKKCRKLTCALPGFKVQNGKCVKKK